MENYDDANSENQDVQKRYEKYAVAQAWLTDNALTIPVMASPKKQPFHMFQKFYHLALHIQ